MSIALFAYLAGPWAFTSYYLRYALIGLAGILVVLRYRRMRLEAVPPNMPRVWRGIVSGVILVLFALFSTSILISDFDDRDAIDLSFPLHGGMRAGKYYVLQGGNNLLTNPFHVLSGSGLALDIVRLNASGNRAWGLAPRALERYEIFGDTLYAPCSGRVTALRNDLPDHAPGEADIEHPAGNYAILKCGDVEILMAHMQQNSIVLNAGDSVLRGEMLGQVGNSGNTLEPHLHIEGRRNGEAVGLLFDGRRLSANSTIVGSR